VVWNEELYTSTKKLRVGYMFSEDSAMTTPKCSRRAVELTVEKLRALGHTVVEFKAPDCYDYVVNSLALLLSYDMGLDQGEALVSGFDTLIKAAMTPEPLKRLLTWWKDANGGRADSYNILMKAMKVNSAWSYIQTYQAVKEFQIKYFKAWKEFELDACIFPFATPSMLGDTCQYMWHTVFHTMVFNALDYPVSSIPVTTVLPQEEEYTGTG
jgi:fatty acid amide hydrolase